MSAPCRVLLLNERDLRHPKAGGAEIHISEIFSRLARRGFAVTHLASGFPGAAGCERVEGVEVRRLGGLPRYYARAAVACARETRAGRFDVVVECLNKVPFFSPLLSAVPVLAITHHLFGEVAFQQVAWPIAAAVWVLERPIPWVYRKCRFVAISESSRHDLVERGLPAARVRTSHCGIRFPSVAADPQRPRPARVAYVGRLEPYKRVDVLLRAVAALAGRFPEVRIDVIGRGQSQPALEQLARELGIAERVRFTGFVPDEERDTLLAGARVCVCPSEKEGWGLTVIEANAVGTPVVASDAPGLRDSVRHGETGFLVPTGDVAAFADRIGALLSDDALAVRMAANALAWSKRFDWDITADEMAEEIELARKEA